MQVICLLAKLVQKPDERAKKIRIPSSQKETLSLQIPFVIAQVIPCSQTQIQLQFQDSLKTKRRVLFSSGIKKSEKKSFIARLPIQLKPNSYHNLCFDMKNLASIFGVQFRFLLYLEFSFGCKVKKVIGFRQQPNFFDKRKQDITEDVKEIPKSLELPGGKGVCLMLRFQSESASVSKQRLKQKLRQSKSIEKRSTGLTVTKVSIQKNSKSKSPSVLLSKGSVVSKDVKNPWTYEPQKQKEWTSKEITQTENKSMTNWGNSQVVSDSQLLEASQRFNTINDPRVFKMISNFEIPNEQDEIEEHIQMQGSKRQDVDLQKQEVQQLLQGQQLFTQKIKSSVQNMRPPSPPFFSLQAKQF